MRTVLFAGKGGVGKTTLAAATSAALAADGHKTLVVSTDPAHSLADAIDAPLSAEPAEFDGGLWAAQVQARDLLAGAWSGLRAHLATLLAGAGVDDIVAEELTVLPGVEELLALSEVQRLARTGPWETVIVDCAPTAESLRLLALPEAAGGLVERLFPTHRRVVRGLLAGMAGVGSSAERWDAVADAIGRLSERMAALRDWLTEGQGTGVRLVLTPERVVAAETRRTVTAMSLQGVRVDGLLVNRMVPKVRPRATGPAASWLRTRRAEQEDVVDRLRTDLPALAMHTVEHRATEPVGLPALLELGEQMRAAGLDVLPSHVDDRQMMSVEHLGGSGLEATYQLRLTLPLLATSDVDLARVDDELAVTAAGHQRLIPLPSVLRRCTVAGAQVDEDELLVRFHPNPALWMR